MIQSVADKGLRMDYLLMGTVAALLVIGINIVYSATLSFRPYNEVYIWRQLLAAAIGLALLIVLMKIDYHLWRHFSLPALAVALALLLAAQHSKLGITEYGSQRWLKLGPLPPFQPSEVAKLAIVLYLADWLSRKGEEVKHLAYGALPFALVLAIVAGLVAMQPDLGTTLVIVATSVTIFFVAGANLVHFAAGLALGGAAVVFLVFGVGYRLQRIVAYLNPGNDPTGPGWQILQSQIALGSGGLFGLGLGNSRQKYDYLPGAHTDAIFAILGEEFGLIGSVTVIALFALLTYCGYRIILESPDPFGRLLATGITGWLTIQAMINISVVTSLIPFTGIPLPFISAGGSSMVTSLAGIVILLNIARQSWERGRVRPSPVWSS